MRSIIQIIAWKPAIVYNPFVLNTQIIIQYMSEIIKIVPYNPDWPELFKIKAKEIKEALGINCMAIYHVGSTSIPHLTAKPKIDIIAAVQSLIFSKQKLSDLGYNYRGGFNIPLRKSFTLRKPPININLHIFEEDDPEIELNLLFRDYLCQNQQAREQYQKLKYDLIAEESSHKMNGSIYKGYTLGKNNFIQNILKDAGFNGLRFVICTFTTELEVAKNFRQKYFFDKANIQDPYLWAFNHHEHEHLLLYQGCQIIGYAHVQLWKDMRAAMRIIVIDGPYRNQGLGAFFITLIEKYLKMKNFKSLHAESSPEALKFYRMEGYTDMPFNDPDGYKSGDFDIPVGKIL